MKKNFIMSFIPLFMCLPFLMNSNTNIDNSTKKMNKLSDDYFNVVYMTPQDYNLLSIEEIHTFLDNGGLVINDKSVGSEIIKSYYDNHYYTEGYNSCVYHNNDSYEMLYFTLGYYNDGIIRLSESNYRSFLGDIIDEIEKEKNSISNYELTTQIYNNSTRHIVYKEDTTSKMCSYTIQMQIIKNEPNYDYIAKSTLIIVPESNYSITNYSFECSLENNLSYNSSSFLSYNSNQHIVETVKDNSIGLNCTIDTDNYGYQMSVSESVNLTMINENYRSTFSTKITSLEIKDNGWWIFQKKYSISDSNKYKLLVNWDADGFINQEIIN